ncbi:MAG: PQQ-like beta-propeller repeat protein, partial [Candidatus Bathyarchaeota archaeon]|nr:PQQ-like beta-propeller repeat protein [Candidatus Bathyarchaeum sp.]
MEIQKNKTIATTVTLILVLSFTSILIALPITTAHDPAWTIPTYAYVALSPNPVGVGQSVYVIMWVHPNPPTASGIGGDRWRDFTITITAPDETTEVIDVGNSDPTGSAWAIYTPTQIGTYEFVFDYPGQVLSWYGPTGLPPASESYLIGRGQDVFVNDTYIGSSATEYLTVQEDPIEKIPDYPLPTEYWTRPIEGQNTAWATVSSHWLGGSQITGLFQESGIAPNSAHILWTLETQFGGVVGGETSIPGVGFYSGGSYEGRFSSAIIMYGRLYFQYPFGHSGGGRSAGWKYACVDLLTGEELWSRDDINPTFGQLYDYESLNQHGVVQGVLWQASGSKWIGYDAFTGENYYNLTNVPSGTEVYTDEGGIVRYVLNYGERWLALWNSTAHNVGLEGTAGYGSGTDSADYQWRPVGKEVDMSKAYTWNVTIPDLPGDGSPAITAVIPGDLILGTSTTWPNFRQAGTPDPWTMWAISDRDDGTRGQLLWIQNYAAPANNITRRISGTHVDAENRVFMVGDDETMQWSGYSLDTGELVWGPTTEPYRAFSYYGAVMYMVKTGYPAYGNLYTQGYGGEVFAYNTLDGTTSWKYNETYAGYESIWGNYPTFIGTIADGKVYTYNHEHSPNY